MTSKPTYQELEQRVQDLEKELTGYKSRNGSVRLNQQYLEVILNNTNLPIYLKDADFNYILINSEYERLAQVTSDQVQGKDDFAIFPKPMAQLFRDQDEEVIQRRTLIEFEETVPLADGVHTFLTSKFPLIDSEGKIYAVGGVCTDITTLQQTKEELRKNEEQYRSFMENFHGIAYRSDIPDFTPIYFHGAVEQITGYSEKDFVAGAPSWNKLVHPDDLPMLIEQEKSMMEIADYTFKREYRISNRDGETRWIFERGRSLYDEKGQHLCIEGTIFDITARKIAEQNLRESEETFRSLIESCPEGMHMYRLEPDGRLLFSGANAAADQILGIDHEQLIDLTIEEAFPSLTDTDIPQRYREVCRNGKSWKKTHTNYKDSRIKGTFDIHAFQSEPGKMAVFFQDVTGKTRMEEELQKMQKLESVGILAGGIAHDFNNLLTAILGNISMARLFSQTDMNKVLERLTDAENASLRARDLTQQLLTFSKGGAPVKTAASITDIIKDSTSFMLSGSNVICDLQFQNDIWPVSIDEGQISQVIQNVIKNADQAMPEGGTVTVRAENMTVHENDTQPLQAGNYIHLTIGDQGVGILKKHLTKIFDPYFSTKQDGSGLGLAACYSIIKNHDGLIIAESKIDSGTTFHIYLPSSDSEPEPKIQPRKKSLRSGEKILVMDDDDDVLKVAVNMLNLMGYSTDTAHDGSEAITRYRKALEAGQPFDGVLLDLTIPGGMGGQETVRQLLLIDPEVKAIVSSGYANDPIMAEYTRYGFHGVATKPYDMEHLGQILRNLFD